MHFVYILRCADASLYIGETEDVTDRVARHDAGTACPHTVGRRPVELVYTEEHLDRIGARQREKQIKRWTRAKKEALIAGDLLLLKRL
jgi:predicted GIY-YIG superfamily endonuclease